MDEAPRFSPDGRLLAYVSEESGQPQVFVRPFPAGPRLAVSIGGGSAPVWAADSGSLYFAESEAGGLSRLLVTQVILASDGPRATPPSPVVPGMYRLSTSGGAAQYDVATSGRLLVAQMDERDRREANRIHVLLNLTAESKARLP